MTTRSYESAPATSWNRPPSYHNHRGKRSSRHSDYQTSDCISGVFVWPTPGVSVAKASTGIEFRIVHSNTKGGNKWLDGPSTTANTSYPARLSGLIREISLADSVMASYRSQFCCRFSQNSGVVPRS